MGGLLAIHVKELFIAYTKFRARRLQGLKAMRTYGDTSTKQERPPPWGPLARLAQRSGLQRLTPKNSTKEEQLKTSFSSIYAEASRVVASALTQANSP